MFILIYLNNILILLKIAGLLIIAMNNKYLHCTVILLCTFFVGYAQTTLSEGDISIIGLDTPSEDFVFVTFVDLEAGTQIYFTDEEPAGNNSIGAGEGTVLYTAPLSGIAAGQVISYVANASDFSITSDGNIQLADAGDGLLAYQGAAVGSVTTFLHAVGEDLVAIGTYPSGFSSYVLIGSDDGEYFGVRDGETAAIYFSEVNNSSNWNGSGSGVSPFNLINFTFEADENNDCSELFISEYVEGSSNNKYIEIYNPTNQVITLTNTYVLQIYANGNNYASTIDLVGNIEPFGVFLISHNLASLGIVANQLSSTLFFNGNDAVALSNATNIIDLIGVIGEDLDFAKDTGLKRKNNIQHPALVYDDLEWEVLAEDDVSSLGFHFGDCGYVCTSSKITSWNGVNWSDGSPNKYTTAILNNNYNTSLNGGFEACFLEVNADVSLVIGNSTTLEIQNGVEVKGDLIVETQGSFLQINNLANFEVVDNGTSYVQKTAAAINSWYEYTYWSSPVQAATIGNTLVDAPESRRFWFNAQNWLDTYAETGNNNAAVIGQDDIDDNGDDWQYANSNDIMIPGVGYAATYSASKFTGAGQRYSCVFTGAFNNGIITVPVYRNDAEINDSNCNFIGNPYPSAIDVDAFFSENVYNAISNPLGVLGGAIYLWSQNTAPSNTTNGNEAYNFSQSDYAIINGTGSVAASGDPQPPNRFIPSCQGFFVSFSNNATATNMVSGNLLSGNVTFNNTMRVSGNNNQFYKQVKKTGKSISNKLWINLTAEGGLFSQTLVGYVEGATDNLDTSFYDATRNLATGSFAVIYSTIEKSIHKFAIQGKSINSLNLNEEVILGFDTSIESNPVYKIAIAKIEGNFLEGNTIYLEDTFTGFTHNLSESAYTFSSETGVFNNRFKLKFKNEITLHVEEEKQLSNLLISNLDDENVQFSVSKNLVIEHVQIIDLLGRTLVESQEKKKSITVNLERVTGVIYFAKVTLSNNQVIVKTLLKK